MDGWRAYGEVVGRMGGGGCWMEEGEVVGRRSGRLLDGAP